MHWFLKPGLLFPFVGNRRLPVNRDGSPFDSGKADLLEEKAPFYIDTLAFEWLGIGIPLSRDAVVKQAATGHPALEAGVPSLTDAQIAVRLMALDEEENIDRWVAHWDPIFADWGNEEHAGDCTGLPHTCNRCVHDDYMGRVPHTRRLFDIK